MNKLKKCLWIPDSRDVPGILGRAGNDRGAGFTLIELLVAMGIIAVLTGMAAFNFNQSRIRARDIQRKNDLSQLQKAMELYRNDNNGNYPLADSFQDTLKLGGYTKTTFNDPRELWSTYYYVPADDLKTYYLMACLENITDQTKTPDSEKDTICTKFRSPASCRCGATPADTSGVMYTLSQP
ncbi:MAG: hypothetical protein ACD_58C00312G0001 [uncultured bacterium]|nr:MAG: hypothetical protein ACD_58C00312G0001 [uncultured bacterium]